MPFGDLEVYIEALLRDEDINLSNINLGITVKNLDPKLLKAYIDAESIPHTSPLKNNRKLSYYSKSLAQHHEEGDYSQEVNLLLAKKFKPLALKNTLRIELLPEVIEQKEITTALEQMRLKALMQNSWDQPNIVIGDSLTYYHSSISSPSPHTSNNTDPSNELGVLAHLIKLRRECIDTFQQAEKKLPLLLTNVEPIALTLVQDYEKEKDCYTKDLENLSLYYFILFEEKMTLSFEANNPYYNIYISQLLENNRYASKFIKFKNSAQKKKHTLKKLKQTEIQKNLSGLSAFNLDGKQLSIMEVKEQNFSFFTSCLTSWSSAKSENSPITIYHPSQKATTLFNAPVPLRALKPIIITSNPLLAFNNKTDSDYVWLNWNGDFSSYNFKNIKNYPFFIILDLQKNNFKSEAAKLLKIAIKNKLKLVGFLRPTELDHVSKTITCEFIPPALIERKFNPPIKIHTFTHEENPPAPKLYLSPFLIAHSMTMIYAKTGVGKTWLALAIALTCAHGTDLFDEWKCEMPMPVFYIDGEMGENTLNFRLKKLQKRYQQHERNDIHIISDDALDLSDETTQQRLLAEVLRKEKSNFLIIFDNLSSLIKKPSSVQAWKNFESWLIELKKKRNISSILIHHANKTGECKGLSEYSFAFDTVINLSKPSELSDSIKLTIEKSRHSPATSYTELPLQLCSDSDSIYWNKLSEIESSVEKNNPTKKMDSVERDKKIISLSKEGYKELEISKIVGWSHSTVKRVREKNGLTNIRNK